MVPFAIWLSTKARTTLGKRLGSEDKAQRLVLSLFFRAVVGIQRIFHFDTMPDIGFAILTGGRKALSRSRLGGLVRAVSAPAVKAFAAATERFGDLRDKVVSLSIDEHSIARFTRKFRIQKGFHAIRNRYMRVEKVIGLYWPAGRRFLHVAVTRGKASLATWTSVFIRALRARVHPRQLRIILDAGASTSHAGLCGLDRHRTTVFLIRAPRHRAAIRAWKELPHEAFTPADEPGRYTGAKRKEIAFTETTTRIRGIKAPVRTVIVRENAASGKHRWHALYILHDSTTPPLALLHEYRTRQHHEQGHRIGVHDLGLDTIVSGYPKTSRPDRPGFRQGPTTLSAWITTLAGDALRELGLTLPKRFHLAHPRTLRRWVLHRSADLFLTRSHLLVVLDDAREQAWLRPPIRALNERAPTLPWLNDRHIVIGFAAPDRPADAKVFVEEVAYGRNEPRRSVWC